jgi:hypothetical protein
MLPLYIGIFLIAFILSVGVVFVALSYFKKPDEDGDVEAISKSFTSRLFADKPIFDRIIRRQEIENNNIDIPEVLMIDGVIADVGDVVVLSNEDDSSLNGLYKVAKNQKIKRIQSAGNIENIKGGETLYVQEGNKYENFSFTLKITNDANKVKNKTFRTFSFDDLSFVTTVESIFSNISGKGEQEIPTGYVLTKDEDSVAWKPKSEEYILYYDPGSTVLSETTTVGKTWYQRNLNTMKRNHELQSVTIDSNAFYLEKGEWTVSVSAPGYRCDLHQLKLTTLEGEDVAFGSSEFSPSSNSFDDHAQTRSFLDYNTTLEEKKGFRIMHYITTQNKNNFGLPVYSGNNQHEIYTKVILRKIL